MVSLADLVVSTPSTQPPEEGSTGEEPKEGEPNGLNKDLLDSPRNDGPASTADEEEELKVEKTQLDQPF